MLTFLFLLVLVVVSVFHETHTTPVPSFVLGIAPNQLEYGQRALIHLYSTVPIHVVYSTPRQDMSTPENHTESIVSKFLNPIYLTEIHYEYPYLLDEVGEGEIRFFVQTDGTGRSLVLRHWFRLSQRDKLIVIETDSSRYVPGSNILITVALIRSQYWTMSGVADLSKIDGYVPMTEYFSTILIRTNQGHVVHRWHNVTFKEALGLHYTIDPDPPYGQWTVEVMAAGGLTIKRAFMVTSDVRTSPSVTFSNPHWPMGNETALLVTVCAADSDGQPTQRVLKAQLCQCPWRDSDENGVTSEQDSRLILTRESCIPTSDKAFARPCAVQRTTLDNDGCQTLAFQSSELGLTPHGFTMGNEKFLLCAQYLDGITGKYFFSCQSKVLSDRSQTPLLTTFPPYYKYGLPTARQVHVTSTNWAGKHVNFELTQQANQCPLTKGKSKDPLKRTVMNFNVSLDAENSGLFVIPPIYSFDSFYITPPESLRFHSFSHMDRTILSGAYSTSGEMIELWPQEEIRLNCHQVLTLNILGNTPLNHKTMLVYSQVRGTIYVVDSRHMRTEDVYCEDQDGVLGHYTCIDREVTEIRCLPGWQGPDCLTPICHSQCHPKGGFCMLPGECKCHPNWIGQWCELCSPPEYIISGDNCSYPWYNATKSTKQAFQGPFVSRPTEQPNGTTLISHRTIFHKTLHIKVDRSLYGRLRFVIFYIKILPDDLLEFIATYADVYIEDNCADASVVFSKDVSMAGSPLWLYVLPEHAKPAEDNVCHLRIWGSRLAEEQQPSHVIGNLWFSQLFKTRHMLQNAPTSVPASDVDFWYANLPQLHTVNVQQGQQNSSFDIDRDCHFYCCEIDHKETQSDVQFSTRQFPEIMWSSTLSMVERGYGLRFDFTVPLGITHMRTTTYCYGSGIGFWSASSAVVKVNAPVDFHIAGPSRMQLNEIAAFEMHMTWNDFNSPSRILVIDVVLDKLFWNPIGPTHFVYILTDVTSHVFVVTALPTRLGMLPVRAELRIDRRDILQTERESASAQNVTSETIIRQRTHSVMVWSDGSDEQHNSFIACPLLNSNETNTDQDVMVSLPSEVNSSTNVDDRFLHYFVGGEAISSILMHLDVLSQTLFLSANGYNKLAALCTTVNVLQYLTIDSNQYAELFQRFVSISTRIAASSLLSLQAHRCTTGFYSPVKNACNNSEVLFNAMLYESVSKLKRVLLTLASYELMIAPQNMDAEILDYLVAEQQDDGGFSELATSLKTVEKVTYNAWLYIHLSECKVYTMLRRPNVTVKLVKALENFLIREVSIEQLKHNFTTHSLAILARALAYIDSEHEKTNKVIELIQSKKVSQFEQDSSKMTTYWKADLSSASDLETTANCYLALKKTGENIANLLPIVRWILGNQLMDGSFPTPIGMISAVDVLFDFSTQMGRTKTGEDKIPVQINITIPGSDEPIQVNLENSDEQIGKQYSQRTVDLPAEVKFQISDTTALNCLAGQVGLIYADINQTHVSTQLKSQLEMNVTHELDSDCLLANVTIQFQSQEDELVSQILLFTIIPQSGWEPTEECRVFFQNQDYPLEEKPQFKVETEQFGLINVYFEPGQLDRGLNIQVLLAKRSSVPLAKPMRIRVIGDPLNEPIHDQAYRIPECSNRIAEMLNQSMHVIDFVACPNIISADDVRGWEHAVRTRLNYGPVLHMIQFLDSVESGIPVKVYAIDEGDVIIAWEEMLPPSFEQCGSFNSDRLYLILRTDDTVADRPNSVAELNRAKWDVRDTLKKLGGTSSIVDKLIDLTYGF